MARGGYRVEFAPAAARRYRKLSPDVLRRLHPAIDDLANDPRLPDSKKLAGLENLSRTRVGDYRVVYSVDDRRLVVLVVRIAHRSSAYS